MMTPNLREALRLAAMNVCTIPLKPRSKTPALRSWARWQFDRPTDDQLRQWFSDPDIGLGVVCGEVSGGLLVRDFDRQESYDNWANLFVDAARSLPTVATARGRHLYARLRGSLPRTRKFDDGELRSDGAYVVGPPSLHPTGFRYAWLGDEPREIPVIDDPESLFATPDTGCLTAATDAHNQNPWHVSHSVHGSVHVGEQPHTLAEVVAWHMPTGPGQRERCLFNLARAWKARSPEASRDELGGVFAVWWSRARHVVATKDEKVSLAAFLRAWGNVRVPAGARWETAVALADSRPAPYLPPDLARHKSLLRLASLCAALSDLSSGAPFFLGCRKAAEYCFTSRPTAARDIAEFLSRGILVCTKRDFIKAREAREYRFIPQQEVPRDA